MNEYVQTKMVKRQELLEKSNTLSINSQIELFNFLKSERIAFMENSNGVFFDLSNICSEKIASINKKLDLLQQFENYTESNTFGSSIDVIENEKVINEKPQNQITDMSSCKVQDGLNFTDVSLFTSYDIVCNKVSKKNNHLKYSVAKKKYNKQISNDIKKIEDSDLNKLEIEEYTI